MCRALSWYCSICSIGSAIGNIATYGRFSNVLLLFPTPAFFLGRQLEHILSLVAPRYDPLLVPIAGILFAPHNTTQHKTTQHSE